MGGGGSNNSVMVVLVVHGGADTVRRCCGRAINRSGVGVGTGAGAWAKTDPHLGSVSHAAAVRNTVHGETERGNLCARRGDPTGVAKSTSPRGAAAATAAAAARVSVRHDVVTAGAPRMSRRARRCSKHHRGESTISAQAPRAAEGAGAGCELVAVMNCAT